MQVNAQSVKLSLKTNKKAGHYSSCFFCTYLCLWKLLPAQRRSLLGWTLALLATFDRRHLPASTSQRDTAPRPKLSWQREVDKSSGDGQVGSVPASGIRCAAQTAAGGRPSLVRVSAGFGGQLRRPRRHRHRERNLTSQS